VTLEGAGEVERVLVFGLWEVWSLEELRCQYDVCASARGFADECFDPVDVVVAVAGEGALNDGDAKRGAGHGAAGCGWVAQ
jgi:hypothetical protein